MIALPFSFNSSVSIFQILVSGSQLFASFQEGQDFFLVQELIKGQGLENEISGQKLQKSQAIDLLKNILIPLSFVHQNRVIHRDIKPKNLMRRTEDKRIVLIDFGSVKEVISRTNSDSEQSITVAVGSRGYMPHEQSMGRPTLSSDIYAVGMTIIEALTGLHPYNVSQLVRDPASGKLNWQELVQVDPRFGEIINKMICEDHHQRYQSASQVLKDLKDYEYSQLDSTLQIDNTPTRINNEQKDKKHLFEITIAVLGVVAAGLGVVPAVIALLENQNKPTIKTPIITEVAPKITVPSKNAKINSDIPLNGKLVESQLGKEQICSDLMLGEEYSCRKYTFAGKSGQKATIEMNSDDFDPFLILQKPDGSKLQTNSDISAKNWNSKIVVDLTEDGIYTIVARTTANGESGNYSIRSVVK